LEYLTKEQQIEGWTKVYGRPISEEEFLEICDNLNGFFTTLKQWSDDEERIKLENERTRGVGNSNKSRQI